MVLFLSSSMDHDFLDSLYGIVLNVLRRQQPPMEQFFRPIEFNNLTFESVTMKSLWGQSWVCFVATLPTLLLLVFLLISGTTSVFALSRVFQSGTATSDGKKHTSLQGFLPSLWKGRQSLVGSRSENGSSRRKAILKGKRNSDDGENDKYDSDDDSNSSSSSLHSLRRAPKLVRDNIAQIIKKSYNASASTFLKKWSWEDLTFSAPFNLLLPNDDHEKDAEFWSELENDEEFYYNEIPQSTNMNETVASSSSFQYPHLPNTTTVTHFCFLVHGHRGLSRDLSYMQAVMRKQARRKQHKRYLYIRSIILQEQKKRSDSQDSSVGSGESSNSANDEQTAEAVQYTAMSPIQLVVEEPESSSNEDVALCHVVQDDTSGEDDSSIEKNEADEQREFLLHELVVHSVTCNEKKTDDGVIAGGERMVDEIISFIREHMEKKNTEPRDDNNNGEDALVDITISLVGNSLGGLYARYAAAKLTERCSSVIGSDCVTMENSNTTTIMVLDNRYRLHWNTFCTTATPHLGLSGHTFVPLPRTAEFGVARALGETGRDLFRLNTLLHEMATNRSFIKPLGQFRKRIAYANAYGTDFPVPVGTAAFLSESSTYPHHFVDQNNENDNNGDKDTMGNPRKNLSPSMNESTTSEGANAFIQSNASPTNLSSGLVVATLHTRSIQESPHITHHDDHVIQSKSKRQGDLPDGNEPTSSDDVSETARRELASMSTSLDSLGWKKVFVDVRKQIPRISISKSLLRVGTSAPPVDIASEEGYVDDTTDSNPEDEISAVPASGDRQTGTGLIAQRSINRVSGVDTKCIHQLKEKGVISSKDVAAAVTTTPLLSTDSNEISLHWPVGHNMMVAFSRSRWSAYMNKAGRPVVDALAKELVDDIFAFRCEKSNSTVESRRTSNICKHGDISGK